MRHPRSALAAILYEAGINRPEAWRITHAIDNRREGGLHSDDVAGALLRWAETRATMHRVHDLAVAAAARMRASEDATLPLPWDG
jgi:hypothetical protein